MQHAQRLPRASRHRSPRLISAGELCLPEVAAIADDALN